MYEVIFLKNIRPQKAENVVAILSLWRDAVSFAVTAPSGRVIARAGAMTCRAAYAWDDSHYPDIAAFCQRFGIRPDRLREEFAWSMAERELRNFW